MGTPHIPMVIQTYKVLIPTDFSEDSRRAVEYVLSAFAPKLTHLYILHAYREKSLEAAPMISLIDILHEKAERLMQAEVRHARAIRNNAALEIIPLNRFDGLLQAILDVAETEDVDLVVMGSNGNPHPRHDSKEEDPAQILHRLRRPLLLVPKLLS